jgi:hypothetical protein
MHFLSENLFVWKRETQRKPGWTLAAGMSRGKLDPALTGAKKGFPCGLWKLIPVASRVYVVSRCVSWSRLSNGRGLSGTPSKFFPFRLQRSHNKTEPDFSNN